MRVLYIHQYFNTPEMAGSTRSYELAIRLGRMGHEVDVITTARNTPSFRAGVCVQEVAERVRVTWIPIAYSQTMGVGRRLVAFCEFAVRAILASRRVPADVVFASSTPLTVAIPGMVVARSKQVPMVFEVRDLWPEIPISLGVIRNPVARWFARRLERSAYNNAKAVVALSPGMADGVKRTGYPRDQIAVIPNGVNAGLGAIDLTRAERFRMQQLGTTGNRLVVYTGSLGRVNGVRYLVEIAHATRKLDTGIRFVVMGQGAHYDETLRYAEKLGVLNENFFMRPPIAKRDMPWILAASDIACSLVIPNELLWHNSANKVFDAWGAGCPILINYGGWQAKLVRETGAGIVVPPNEPTEAAEILCEFLSDEARLDSARLAASNLARDHFDWDILARKLDDVLRRAVGDVSSLL